MPAGTTVLAVSAAPSTPAGPAENLQASDTTPGNRFVNAPGTMVLARNTTGAPATVLFEADLYGSEITLLSHTLPANELRLYGPFPPAFNEHGTTEAASNGSVFVRQSGGIDGDVEFQPYVPNRALTR